MTIIGSMIAMLIILVMIPMGFIVIAYNKHREKVKRGQCRKYNGVFIALCGFSAIIDFLIYGFILGWDVEPESIIPYILIFILPGIVGTTVYFLPYLIANSKCHCNETAIFVLNLFAGWTIIAWIIALVWSCTQPKSREQQIYMQSGADEIKKYKELFDAGIITEEEFEEKKVNILNGKF